jgi:Zn-dependent metalloprotease
MNVRSLRAGHVVWAFLGAAAFGAAGCSSEPEPKDVGARLEADTGVPWGVFTDPRSGEVRFLAPETPVRFGDGNVEQAARVFFDRYGEMLGATTKADELRDAEISQDASGGSYVRFAHYLPGTTHRVFDVATLVHVDADGHADAIIPGFRAHLLDVAHEPAISLEAASLAARAFVSEHCKVGGDEMTVDGTELGVTAAEANPLALAFRVSMRTSSALCAGPDVDVDATTGSVLAMHERARSFWDKAPGVRHYALGESSSVRTIDITPRRRAFGPTIYTMTTEAPSPKVHTKQYRDYKSEVPFDSTVLGRWDSTWPFGTGSAVDAHFHVSQGLRYFKEIHGHQGVNGKRLDVTVVVHDNSEGHTFGGITASWLDDKIRVGDGTSENLMALSAAFDVMVHELTHGIVRHTSKLIYEFDSGALDESFSDVMASTGEKWFDSWHEPTRNPRDNLILGERSKKRGNPIRSMVAPTEVGGQVDYYDGPQLCFIPGRGNDHCFVHKRSGIGNRAWSLMTLGGVHRRSKIEVKRGIGWETSRALWFETMTHLPPQATFQTAALAQLVWAAKKGPAVLTAVGCAWHAVGVLTLDPVVSPIAGKLACASSDKAIAPPTTEAAPADDEPASTPKTPDCAGRASGWVCSENVPNTALECKSGNVTGAKYCVDPKRKCKMAAADDWTAALDANGELLCE